MTRLALFAAGLLALAAPLAPALAQSAETRVGWNRPFEPFRIRGNLYYVGTAGLSSYLLTGKAGHVLIDGALPESAPQIAANIQKLGFRLRDVRIILINHSHVDHAGGLAKLKALTGAKLYASAGDMPDLEAGRTLGRTDLSDFPPVHVDRLVRDGQVVALGPIRLTALLTPGHTKGATSWLTTLAGKRVIFASSISVAGQKLVGNEEYPSAAADFEATFRKLKSVKADIFLNYHAEGFGLNEKRAVLNAGKADAFVDPGELGRVVAASEKSFTKELASQKAGNPPS
ncbi:subclass B3 metallo-beta-lactamase [Sphingomonas sp. AP4-R1]|uniref:subclass B3 metallo-beta-lactamase n=1 Tax=Sphingomonas sp. AP4-R1 TaxID=2735134 RepID=UPI001493D621|nr:subclass B3 metallo-beta-lactamase [Sphingomonas sp. AP4-R1]QJU58065.1 subclass B3 metallo-beta-lactamase [Sphingomonas sp. AP4-R1]